MADETATRLDNLDVAYASGWHVESTDMIDVFKKGDTVIEVRYTMNDDLDRAVKRRPNGDTETIGVHTTAKVDRLRSWLTGDNRQHRGERFVSAGPPTSDRSQLYSEFWHQFRNRVAAEHPDWRLERVHREPRRMPPSRAKRHGPCGSRLSNLGRCVSSWRLCIPTPPSIWHGSRRCAQRKGSLSAHSGGEP